MKQIRIQEITQPDKTSFLSRHHFYSVYIGDQRFNYFTSEKKAREFLAKTNKFLNDCLQIINYVHVQVYAEYRAVWFYADTAFNHVNAIEAELKNCETYMDRSISNSTGLNGNYMAFNHLTKSCSCLIKSCEIIIKIYMEKKIFVPCHRLKYLIEQANYTRVKLANYSVKQLQDVELESIEETSY